MNLYIFVDVNDNRTGDSLRLQIHYLQQIVQEYRSTLEMIRNEENRKRLRISMICRRCSLHCPSKPKTFQNIVNDKHDQTRSHEIRDLTSTRTCTCTPYTREQITSDDIHVQLKRSCD